MKSKYYVLKVDGNWFVDIDLQEPTNPKCKVSATSKVELAKKMNENGFSLMAMGLARVLSNSKIEGYTIEIETEPVETSDEYIIRFKANGKYFDHITDGGLRTTKEIDCATAYCKEHAEAWVKHFEAYDTLDIMPDDLQGGHEIIPVKRTYSEPVAV